MDPAEMRKINKTFIELVNEIWNESDNEADQANFTNKPATTTDYEFCQRLINVGNPRPASTT